ncbi:hypothetical protein LAZ67_2003594 [Cordylochernes scorpioides]|uniref:Uncharacterized protein n=1 Tax=Cordylochernes scorpioides TaxID=51811 RepID=A0ABY6K312_9ARAC|nr:hypothetical protein LAZ67_2003594 [Cordylochernes scorpioides]
MECCVTLADVCFQTPTDATPPNPFAVPAWRMSAYLSSTCATARGTAVTAMMRTPNSAPPTVRDVVTVKRPPVEETANFLQTLLANHGPNYLEKLFGSKARDALAPLGGVNKVAIALSGESLNIPIFLSFVMGHKVLISSACAESETLEDFGKALHLMRSDMEHLRNIFMAIDAGDISLLRSMGIRDSELGDVKFFLDKLVSTGFMD